MLHHCSSGRASFLGRRALYCRQAVATTRTTALTNGNGAPGLTSASDQPTHVTIVGGGAAGLTAAFFAAEHGARVTVLERTREAGKKILMSGGSRCNVLPLEVDLQTDFFSGSSPSAVRAVFASWNLDLCKAWLEDPYWGIGLDLQLEEETKKYFPSSNSSREVRDKLVAACLARGVVFKYGASVEGLQLLLPQAEAPAADSGPAEPGHETSPAATQAEAVSAAAAENGEVAAMSGNPAGSGDGGARRRKKGRGPRVGGAPAAAAADAPAAATGSTATAHTDRSPKAQWLCSLGDGTEHVTDRLIVATGGLSFPAVGTDGTGHRLLRALGHRLDEPYPALTPLTGGHPAGEQLAGVSMYGIELSVQIPGTKRAKVSERTALLFTHKGYSGPAVLDLSHYAVKALTRGSVPPAVPSPDAASAVGGAGAGAAGASRYAEMGLPSIRVNWTNEPAAVWDERIRAGGTAHVTTLLQRHGLRERLAEALVSELGLTDRRVCDVKKAERAALVSALTSYELPYHGHEGYKKAEVTGGGVRLEELDCATMQSRLLPNLYLCGEIVDVFGRIGGFNFYWAWVSGRLAGIGAAQGGLRPKARREGTAGTGTSSAAVGRPSAAAA